MNRVKRVGKVCLTLFCLFLSLDALAQNDTAFAVQQGRVEATVHRMPEVKPHSAKKALILSAVLPGAGQVYNGQAWKIPIIYAAIGGIGYYTYSNYVQMKYYKDEYLYRVNHDGASLHPDDAELATTPTTNVYNLYETYDKTFQLSVIISVAVYGLNLLDAYVFGHLYDFQITDDLTLNVAPQLLPCTPAFGTQAMAFGFVPAASVRLKF